MMLFSTLQAAAQTFREQFLFLFPSSLRVPVSTTQLQVVLPQKEMQQVQVPVSVLVVLQVPIAAYQQQLQQVEGRLQVSYRCKFEKLSERPYLFLCSFDFPFKLATPTAAESRGGWERNMSSGSRNLKPSWVEGCENTPVLFSSWAATDCQTCHVSGRAPGGVCRTHLQVHDAWWAAGAFLSVWGGGMCVAALQRKRVSWHITCYQTGSHKTCTVGL